MALENILSGKMKKRQPQYIRKLMAKPAREQAQANRTRQREKFAALLKKDRIEVLGDLFDLFRGLSVRSRERAVLAHLYELVARGYRPSDIVRRLEEPFRKKGGERA